MLHYLAVDYVFQWDQAFTYLPYLLGGAFVTLHLSFIAFWIACVIGLFGALAKTYGRPGCVRLVNIYVVFMINVPGLVTAFFNLFLAFPRSVSCLRPIRRCC